MRAIVTGGAGFVGSHLVDRLRSQGWSVRVIDSALGEPIQAFVDPPAAADAIFHLASPVGPVGVLPWAGRLALEVVGTATMVARWALALGCPLVDVSTSEVYGSGRESREEDDCRFAAPSSARKEYAVAKLAAETTLLNTSGLDVRIVRPFNVTGPGQKTAGGFVLPRFISQALRGEAITVYRPGSQRRSFTHVADVVEGLLAALERGRPGEVYNLGNAANACSIRRLAEEVREEAGSGSPIIVVDPRELHGPAFREAPDKVPNAEKARLELGWVPRFDRRTTIRDAIAAERLAAAA